VAHRCPPWFCFTFDNRFRRLFHDAARLFSAYVREGTTVLDVGAGKGYFSVPLARMVGEKGRVIAADIEPKMLEAIERRAGKAGVAGRVSTLRVHPDMLEYPGADFVLFFWSLHEMSGQEAILGAVRGALRPDGRVYIAEPRLHVGEPAFENLVRRAERAGFAVDSRPPVALSRAVVLR
jgi:ubiquinone/menaquinone biosynthesis C-methylase UbiE